MSLTRRQITSKRRRAAELSRSMKTFRPNSAEREELWRELAAEGVTPNELADDSDVTPIAVRQVLNRKPR